LNPSISIIVAIYNRKDELFELLTSLTRQTDKEFEIIIVDDGSLIDLKPTIRNFEEILDIKYFRKDNSGPGLTRNYGAARAENEWLVFVDSDVIVEKDYIEHIKNDILTIPCDAFGGADKAIRV
jgi:glycosyltransferase involved in cell wall biosynthesis